jgi:hypothetical protein
VSLEGLGGTDGLWGPTGGGFARGGLSGLQTCSQSPYRKAAEVAEHRGDMVEAEISDVTRLARRLELGPGTQKREEEGWAVPGGGPWWTLTHRTAGVLCFEHRRPVRGCWG